MFDDGSKEILANDLYYLEAILYLEQEIGYFMDVAAQSGIEFEKDEITRTGSSDSLDPSSTQWSEESANPGAVVLGDAEPCIHCGAPLALVFSVVWSGLSIFFAFISIFGFQSTGIGVFELFIAVMLGLFIFIGFSGIMGQIKAATKRVSITLEPKGIVDRVRTFVSEKTTHVQRSSISQIYVKRTSFPANLHREAHDHFALWYLNDINQKAPLISASVNREEAEMLEKIMEHYLGIRDFPVNDDSVNKSDTEE